MEIWLLPTQKPVKRQGWWKVKFILDASNGEVGVGVRVGGENSCPRANSTPPPTISEEELFLRKGDTCRNSIVISDSHLEISPWWSDQHHLGCFKHSYSSVPGSICFCFLEADSPNVKAYIMATVWSSCSYHLPPGGGFSLYEIVQSGGYGSDQHLWPLRRN